MSDLEERLESLEERMRELELKLEGGVEKETDSLKEFVKNFDLEKHNDIVLAIGYYLENREGQRGFTSSDIEEGYKRAKIQPYSNFSVLLSRMIENNLIMVYSSDTQRKMYTLTHKGEEKIEGEL